MEETVVRDKAVESACVVIELMQGGQQEVWRFFAAKACFPIPAYRYDDISTQE